MCDPVETVYRALWGGELRPEDLSARRLGALVGKTTSVLYHHWGSLDGFLFAVSQRGYRDLGEVLAAALARRNDLRDVAEVFVVFGLEHPALYPLMFERRYDWDALRAAGAFEETPGGRLWETLTESLRRAGARDPDMDARLLHAGLHGLVSLAASGRANVGALSRSDREVARAAARELAHRICPGASKHEEER